MCSVVEDCIFCDFPAALDLSTLRGTTVCPNYLAKLETFRPLPSKRLRNVENLQNVLTSLTEKTENAIADISQKNMEIEALQEALACKKKRLEILKKENVREQVCLYALAKSIIKSEEEKKADQRKQK